MPRSFHYWRFDQSNSSHSPHDACGLKPAERLHMAELAYQDRLQPALLDRLSDDVRSIVVVEVRTTRTRLEEQRISIDAIELSLRPFGLRPLRPDRDSRPQAPDDSLVVRFTGPADTGTLARVRAAPVATGADPVPVAQFAEVSSRTVLNVNPETAEQRTLSMRRLRECVLRDLSWLLSTVSFDTRQDLAAWPAVARSVLNSGLPSVAGLGSGNFDPVEAARRLQTSIESFEPRLTHVRVTPEFNATRMDMHALKFRVEAQLWGHPTPQQLLLRTQIDVESADVVISDYESG
jgi:type VI secretion system protein ImpF